MAPSHSLFVRKLPCGTLPHGMAHIRWSVGHLTLHEHSAAAASEATTENTMRRPASRRVIARPAGLRRVNAMQASQEPNATVER